MGVEDQPNQEAPPLQSATAEPIRFTTPAALPLLEAAFDGGHLTSDGGLPWLLEADSHLGLCAALAAVVPEWRRGPVRHSRQTLVRQRVFQISCGYEDQNDADTLRQDPLLKLVCGRLPDGGADLASQPTLSRLENAVNAPACYRLAVALFECYLRERERGGLPRRIRLDFDGTDDPTHGEQEGSVYHGFYDQHMLHPLLVYDADTDQLITAVLRPGNAHASRGAVAVLKRLVGRLRDRWPEVEIELRADSGFAVPALYEFCERDDVQVSYTIGLVTNPRLRKLAEPLLEKARAAQAQTEGGSGKVRLCDEAVYQAGTWPSARRVVFKVELLEKGPNTRFVVTNKPGGPALWLYDGYVDRGEAEGWIKDYKNACFADRLSCHRFVANQFRLFLHAAAYWLMDTLRRWLRSLGMAGMQLDTLRLRLIKVGGRVCQWMTRVRLKLASAHPGQEWWDALARRPGRSVNRSG